MDKKEHAKRIAKEFSRQVNEITPPGTAAGSRFWERVAAPCDDLFDALAAWENSTSVEQEDELRRQVQAAYGRALTAWLHATENNRAARLRVTSATA
jgi:hypothetical protein